MLPQTVLCQNITTMRRRVFSATMLMVVGTLTGCRAAPSFQTPPTVQLKLDNCILMREGNGDNDLYSWGIRMGVSGSNEICIAPSTVVNSTFLTAEGICDEGQLKNIDGITMTLAQCHSRRGGFIGPAQVPSVPSADVAALGELNKGWTNLGNTIDAAVAASLLLQPRESVTMVEGLITQGQMSTQSHLGLAAGSTLLQTLKDNGMIGARSWGLNSGSRSVQAPRRGSLVLGGYDSASLLDGQFYEFDIKNQLHDKRYCPLQVTITSFVAVITSDQENMTDDEVPLVTNVGPLDVCIEPYDNLFRMDEALHVNPLMGLVAKYQKPTSPSIKRADYQDTLLNLEPGKVYPGNAGDFNITLRITIDQNLTVEIPNHEFQRPLRGLGKDGKPKVNDSMTELQIYANPPSEDSPVFGKIFLSQLYLYVDYESMKFYLARQDPGATVPVPVSSANCSMPGDNGGLSGPTKGLIAVGVVAGVLLLVVALLAYLFYRRVLRPSQQPEPPKPHSPPPLPPSGPVVSHVSPSPLDSEPTSPGAGVSPIMSPPRSPVPSDGGDPHVIPSPPSPRRRVSSTPGAPGASTDTGPYQ